jgi:hypothetical protein
VAGVLSLPQQTLETERTETDFFFVSVEDGGGFGVRVGSGSQEIGACIATRFAIAPNRERYGERKDIREKLFFVLFKRRNICGGANYEISPELRRRQIFLLKPTDNIREGKVHFTPY